jgi:hypothetical protein
MRADWSAQRRGEPVPHKQHAIRDDASATASPPSGPHRPHGGTPLRHTRRAGCLGPAGSVWAVGHYTRGLSSPGLTRRRHPIRLRISASPHRRLPEPVRCQRGKHGPHRRGPLPSAYGRTRPRAAVRTAARGHSATEQPRANRSTYATSPRPAQAQAAARGAAHDLSRHQRHSAAAPGPAPYQATSLRAPPPQTHQHRATRTRPSRADTRRPAPAGHGAVRDNAAGEPERRATQKTDSLPRQSARAHRSTSPRPMVGHHSSARPRRLPSHAFYDTPMPHRAPQTLRYLRNPGNTRYALDTLGYRHRWM